MVTLQKYLFLKVKEKLQYKNFAKVVATMVVSYH